MMRKRPLQNDGRMVEDEPIISKEKGKNKKGSSIIFKFIILTAFILYVIIPLSVYLCPAVRRHAVFLNYVSLSRQKNLSLPEEVGLSCTRNFYIPSGDNIKLGVWHIPPQSVLSKCVNGKIPISEEFNDKQPVILYLHGNAGTRGGGHRVELYKVLSQKLDAHIVAFDYRGFGDSTNESPTEAGLVQDTEYIYNWLLQRVDSSHIFIWGHSLGTGVGVAFLDKISNSKHLPAALILEAPFTSIIDAAQHHPLSIFHRYMPFFDILIAKPIGDKDTAFNSLSRISNVKCPLLILHAEDDGFVPFNHGKQLYEHALKMRKKLPTRVTRFVGFDGKLDLGHKNIYKNPDLPVIIKRFILDVQPNRLEA